jgi:opacity protein-like surface antigen
VGARYGRSRAGNRTLTNDITEQVFRLGLNYKFGGPVFY